MLFLSVFFPSNPPLSPPSRTNWTRLVPLPVLSGHAAHQRVERRVERKSSSSTLPERFLICKESKGGRVRGRGRLGVAGGSDALEELSEVPVQLLVAKLCGARRSGGSACACGAAPPSPTFPPTARPTVCCSACQACREGS